MLFVFWPVVRGSIPCVEVSFLKFPSSFDSGVDICKPADGEGLTVELAGCHPALGSFVPPVGGGDGPEGSGRVVG